MYLFSPLHALVNENPYGCGEITEWGWLVTYGKSTRRLRALGLIEYCGTSHIKITPEGTRALNDHIGSRK